MTIAWPKIVVTQDIPDFFYSYERYDLVYSITLSVAPTSTAVISYLDTDGEKVETYRWVFTEHPAKIEDIGYLLEPFVKSGKREWFLDITSTTTGAFTRTFRVDYVTPDLVIKEGIKKFSFSSALNRLSFSMVGTRSEYSAKFELRHGVETILSENYVPDANNEIVIYELPSLIEPYLQDKLISNFEIEITAISSDTNSILKQSKISFTASYCKADVNISADDFINRFFLSTLMGAKVTALGQKEYLHFVTTDEDFVSGDEGNQVAVQIYADYVDSEMKKTSNVFEWAVPINAAEMQIITIDVSPLNFVKKGMTLVAYKVVVGDRTQMFCVSQHYDSEPDIIFKNSFGLFETLYFTGTKEDAPEISRSAAYVNGEYRNYHIEENRIVKANTGIIPETMVCLVDELARSTEAYLIEKGEIGRQITITESESKRTNDLDSLFSFQVTYRIAKRNQNILNVFCATRTFDKTFDKTFK
jgi:hypothetical protein